MDVMARRRAIMAHIARLVKKIISSVTGLVSFTTNVIRPVKVTCEFSPVQEGTGDPSPDNVRPISGWTGCEIGHTGKNLSPSIDDTVFWNTAGYLKRDGTIVYSGSYRTSAYLQVAGGHQYVFSTFDKNENARICWNGVLVYDSNKQPIQDSFYERSAAKVAITVPEGGSYVRIYTQLISAVVHRQLELGSTATAYEPYQGETVGFNFGIPTDYQEVEYVESPGFCYFDIAVPTNNSVISSDIVFQGTTTDNNTWYAGDGRNSTIQHEYGYLGGWYNINVRATYEEINGTGRTAKIHAHYNDYTRDGTSDIIWRMFGRYGFSSAAIGNVPPVKIFSCHLTVDGEKAFDLIPCYRKSDMEVGMFDIITGTFYTNQGTGEGFIAGPDASTLPGTIYGGTVTLNEDGSVDLVVDREIVDLGTLSYNPDLSQGNGRFYTYGLTSVIKKQAGNLNLLSSTFYAVSALATLYTGNDMMWENSNGSVSFSANGYSDKEQFKTAMSGVQLVYELAIPTTYHFDNIGQLNAFLGTNNIWHNMNGSITAEYYNKQ